MNLYKFKQVIILILIIGVTVGVFLSIKHNKEEKVTTQSIDNQPESKPSETRSLCFYRSDKTDRGFYDKAWLKLNVTGDKVTGEFQNLPAETDSKVGTFEGTINPLEQSSMSRSANVWWSAQAEGMKEKDELLIKWGDGSATVGFGELIDRGDGVYVYKDINNLTYIKSMPQMDCVNMDEKLFVEKYIRDNIGTIATNKAVLGGSWYVADINVNPSTKTGTVTYEDGHIQSKAQFTYTYDKQSGAINFTKFDIAS